MNSQELNQWHTSPLPAVGRRECCMNCQQELSIELEDTVESNERIMHYRKQAEEGVPVGKRKKLRNLTGRWKYRSYGWFHSQPCAASWANRQADGLMKVDKKKVVTSLLFNCLKKLLEHYIETDFQYSFKDRELITECNEAIVAAGGKANLKPIKES